MVFSGEMSQPAGLAISFSLTVKYPMFSMRSQKHYQAQPTPGSKHPDAQLPEFYHGSPALIQRRRPRSGLP
ncbi:Uncharacterized protein HZ326_26650 [Fusarium oxysporum f. sp. albedinis]|nr:Uncharacterized protein HZ326_26650 [Fusarium oxysporum f. sp. albedinis]